GNNQLSTRCEAKLTLATFNFVILYFSQFWTAGCFCNFGLLAVNNRTEVDYRCQHKTHCSGPKDTRCPATMTVVLKRSTEDRRSRSTDRHLGEGYLLQVKWNNNHNHLLISADALRKRDVSKETVERLSDLFQQGHSPSSALDTIKYDLQEEKGDDYFLVAADRSIVPDPGFCYRLYYKIFAKAYGVPSGEGMAVDLQKRLDAINQEHGGRCAQMEVKDGQLIVAICTPVMQRVHAAVQQSGELVFVDSSGNFPPCDLPDIQAAALYIPPAAGNVALALGQPQ
ncbi:uncharacterized protein si:dkey-75a21.2, partial [Lampris incognitus]|uniref:uncharacterized protein si:dkey-75a21.2 n=1 Tax=Lampris incognitus TaxID=2546036 RepID=UPI0024B51E72